MKTRKLIFAASVVLFALSCGYVRGPVSLEKAKQRDQLIHLRPWNFVILTREKDAEDDSGDVAVGICERLARFGMRYTQFPTCFQSGDTYLTVSSCSRMRGASMRFTKDLSSFQQDNPYVRCISTRSEYAELEPNFPDIKLGEISGDDIRKKFGTPDGRGDGIYTYSFGVHQRDHCVGERWYGADTVFRFYSAGMITSIEFNIPGRGC